MNGLPAEETGRGRQIKPEQITFERHIYPILKTHCISCHGESKTESKLDLRQKRLALKGGKGGTALVPGHAEDSPLYYRMIDGEMPPEHIKVRPTAEQTKLVAEWIKAGARNSRAESLDPSQLPVIMPEEREHWAYQPIVSPTIPETQPKAHNPVDSFLLKSLADRGLGFSPEASRESLVRRLAFDLTGLPPTAEEVQEFLADRRPDVWSRWVDHFLASQRYGEHWGRMWLDIAGYADTEGGNELDATRSDAWKYRDYVISALNADKPFDRFVTEQLAGDELVGYPLPAKPSQDASQLLAATGFLRTVADPTGRGEDNTPATRNQVIGDTIKVVSSTFYGMTIGCAECHNHRYDPIPQADYYRLRAVFEPGFNPSQWRAPGARQLSFVKPGSEKLTAGINRELVPLQKLLDEAVEKARERVFQDELKKLATDDMRKLARAEWRKPETQRSAEARKLFEDYPNLAVPRSIGALKLYLELDKVYKPFNEAIEAEEKKIAAVRSRMPAADTIRAFTESDQARQKPPETRLLFRGDVESPKEPVTPGDLSVLYESPSETEITAATDTKSSGRRLALARRLTSGNHPLLARVIVNRVWLGHFGRGLVETPGDFGSQGARPTHPELLDWLASDFMAHGWSLKRLHRQILLTQAWRQSSARRPEGEKVDPENHLWHRMNVRRLSSESVRDSLLAVSAQLQPEMFGPPVPVAVTEDGQPQISGAATSVNRRTIYLQVRRQAPLPALEVFDAPVLDPNCELRTNSNVPTQALWLLNDAFIGQVSARWAEVLKKQSSNDTARIRHACLVAWGRLPTVPEEAAMAAFIRENQGKILKNSGNADGRKSRPEAVVTAEPPSQFDGWSRLAQVILQSNGFLYID
ncbi:MAG: PSD1 and planctomycete cytochrome C domain-containing protein [bacterium]